MSKCYFHKHQINCNVNWNWRTCTQKLNFKGEKNNIFADFNSKWLTHYLSETFLSCWILRRFLFVRHQNRNSSKLNWSWVDVADQRRLKMCDELIERNKSQQKQQLSQYFKFKTEQTVNKLRYLFIFACLHGDMKNT